MIVLGVLQVIVGAGAPMTDSVPLRAPRLDTVAAVAPSIATRLSTSRNLRRSRRHPSQAAQGGRGERMVRSPADDPSIRRIRDDSGVCAPIGRRRSTLQEGHGAPAWAKTTHRAGATALAGHVHGEHRHRRVELVGLALGQSGSRAAHDPRTHASRRRRCVHVHGRQALERSREQQPTSATNIDGWR